MNIIIYGGSFDPIHLGHINLAKAALSSLDAEKLYMIPACDSPYKVGLAGACGNDRLEMCRLAARDPRIEVSDCEISRGGVSYTYQTLREFSQPGRKIYLLTGLDAFMTVQNWKYAALINQMAFVVGGCRNPDERKKLEAHADFLAALGYGVKLLDYEPISVSSTQIRQRISEGLPTDSLLDPEVRKYIDEKGLYR